MTLEEKTPGEIVTSQTVSFSYVVYGFVQEDYREFTDFPSSEDLDAFLADMELDCENILQKKSMAPADAMRSADPFDLQQKVEVSRTVPCSEHDIIPGTNQKPERRRPFVGTGLVRHCPQGLFSPFFTLLRSIYIFPPV